MFTKKYMLPRWKVTYWLTQAAPVCDPIAAYPTISVVLDYNNEGKLTAVKHELDVEDDTSASKVVAISQNQLKLFWELLEYQQGFPLNINNYSVEQLHQQTSNTRSVITRTTSGSACVAIARPIDMPNSSVLTNSNTRLIVWLRLANEARSAILDADAIRNYYMIWEDMHGKATAKSPQAVLELKHVRDFVSHGGILGNRDLLAFIQSQLGSSVNQYDPNDQAQRQFLSRYRTVARELIEHELDQLI